MARSNKGAGSSGKQTPAKAARPPAGGGAGTASRRTGGGQGSSTARRTGGGQGSAAARRSSAGGTSKAAPEERRSGRPAAQDAKAAKASATTTRSRPERGKPGREEKPERSTAGKPERSGADKATRTRADKADRAKADKVKPDEVKAAKPRLSKEDKQIERERKREERQGRFGRRLLKIGFLRRRYIKRLLRSIEKSKDKGKRMPPELWELSKRLDRLPPGKHVEFLEQAFTSGPEMQQDAGRAMRRAAASQDRMSGRGGGRARPGMGPMPPGARRGKPR